uniref:Uncharacterized protein n=1 Tax=Moniliophthora roreri TaxID=221103 RepID=A0A0W0FE68_MONRR
MSAFPSSFGCYSHSHQPSYVLGITSIQFAAAASSFHYMAEGEQRLKNESNLKLVVVRMMSKLELDKTSQGYHFQLSTGYRFPSISP